MGERPQFFPSGNVQLFGVLHEPVDGTGEAFVFCHPFGEEKLWTHRVLVQFARRLAILGHTVLRYDARGTGDSDGDLASGSIADDLADLRAAIDFVRQRTGQARVTLLGLRLGATLAALGSASWPDVARQILWAPIVNGERYAQELLRINLATQLAVHREVREDRQALVTAMRAGTPVNVDGYLLGATRYDDLQQVQPGRQPLAFAGPSLVLRVERMATPPPQPELTAFVDALGAATLQVVREEPFWKEIAELYEEAPQVYEATMTWLEER